MDYPKSDPSIGLIGGKFSDGNPLLGIAASRDPASWANAVTDELLAVITAAGLVPAEADHDQVIEAINLLIAAAKGSCRGEYGIAGSLALTAAHVGKVGYISGAGGYTISLPDPTAYVEGSTFRFINASTATVTIQATAGKTIGGGPAAASFTLRAGSTAELYWNGAAWVLIGGTERYRFDTGAFGFSVGATSHFRHPSGIIVQFGTAVVSTDNGAVAVVLPTSFPVANRAVVPSLASDHVAVSNDAISVFNKTLSGFSIRAAIGSAPINVDWIAIGY